MATRTLCTSHDGAIVIELIYDEVTGDASAVRVVSSMTGTIIVTRGNFERTFTITPGLDRTFNLPGNSGIRVTRVIDPITGEELQDNYTVRFWSG